MLFKRISRSNAETVFIVAKNVSGSTITAGYSCVFDTGGSVDGVRVTQASTTDLSAYAGVADNDIANSAYGLVQVYGYRSAVFVKRSDNSAVIAVGAGLIPVGNEWGLLHQTTSGTAKSFAFLCEAIADSTNSSSAYEANFKGFIRAL